MASQFDLTQFKDVIIRNKFSRSSGLREGSPFKDSIVLINAHLVHIIIEIFKNDLTFKDVFLF